MKPILFLLASTLLGACSATAAPNTAAPQTPVQQGSTPMTTTTPAYTPPLAKGYQPGVPTAWEQIAPQSPYDADEAVRRILRIATQLRKQKDLNPAFIEQTMGLKMHLPKNNTSAYQYGAYWVSKNWLYEFGYAMRSYGAEGQEPVLTFDFLYDRGRWAEMPDRAELCANRQMDVAAAEKILLDNGFHLTDRPHTRSYSWSYYKKRGAAVRIYFFRDTRPIDNKKACIQKIVISI